MTDLIERITEAIFHQEGMPADYPNPGNLRAAPWLTSPTIADGFWQPINRQQGIAGAAHCVALRIAMGQTLIELIEAWAPAADGNNATIYVKNVKNWAAIPDENSPLWNYL